MTYSKRLFLLVIISCLCCQLHAGSIKVNWDKWGIPHIYANSEKELFYAQGWAQMHAHGNLILELYGRSRGRAAEYWGEKKLKSDKLVHQLGLPVLAKQWTLQQDPQLKSILIAFVTGLNDYAKAHPDEIKTENKAVLPLSVDDVNAHALYVFFLNFVGTKDIYMIEEMNSGSNGYAIGKQKSASGNAMLVFNPHLPWHEEYTWFECHFNYKDKNIYGANLVGFPGLTTAFNLHLGWTHTNNPIDNADTYELILKDGGYLMDNKRKEFRKSIDTLKVKNNDGSFRNETIEVLQTEFGAVVRKDDKKAHAIKFAGIDRPNILLQWWKMANSNNFEEFEAALKLAQIPFWNILYADDKSNILYVCNGLIPKRDHGDWKYWNRVIPGGSSKDIWHSYLSYDELPKVKNPSTGWLQNSNDPPWSCTVPRVLDPKNYPPYMAPQFMSLRTQRAVRMMQESKAITFDQLVDIKLSTRFELADRILDELLNAIDTTTASEELKEARNILIKWDRCADNDSKGTLLFAMWAKPFLDMHENFAVKWDRNNPDSTPCGFANKEKAVQLLDLIAQNLKTNFGGLDTPWGEFYRLKRNGYDLPANGLDSDFGIFRVADYAYGEGKHGYVGGGDSWQGVVEFGKKVKAKALISYGNSSQPNSPHNGDQLKLFSEKTLRDVWFYEEDLKGNVEKTEVLNYKD